MQLRISWSGTNWAWPCFQQDGALLWLAITPITPRFRPRWVLLGVHQVAEMDASNQNSIPPLTAQEVAVVSDIRRLLTEIENAGAGRRPGGTLKYLSDDILRQSVAERVRTLTRARDRYAEELNRLRTSIQQPWELRAI